MMTTAERVETTEQVITAAHNAAQALEDVRAEGERITAAIAELDAERIEAERILSDPNIDPKEATRQELRYSSILARIAGNETRLKQLQSDDIPDAEHALTMATLQVEYWQYHELRVVARDTGNDLSELQENFKREEAALYDAYQAAKSKAQGMSRRLFDKRQELKKSGHITPYDDAQLNAWQDYANSTGMYAGESPY